MADPDLQPVALGMPPDHIAEGGAISLLLGDKSERLRQILLACFGREEPEPRPLLVVVSRLRRAEDDGGEAKQ